MKPCPHCGMAIETLQDATCRRLKVPATPSELAATFDVPVRTMRATLHNLKNKGKARRLDKTVPCESKRGRKSEYLWQS